MFTGIVEAAGKIASVQKLQGLVRLRIEAPFSQELVIGQSVAHNGVCLTVEEIAAGGYTVAVIQESLNRTSLGALREGMDVNLERCLPANGRLDGHVVQGHVDCTGRIEAVLAEPGQTRFVISHPAVHAVLVVEKGSIAVDGISLTVASVHESGGEPAAADSSASSERASFDVCLIPHTLSLTNAGAWKQGDLVNLEFDILGKYVKKWMDARGSVSFPGMEK